MTIEKLWRNIAAFAMLAVAAMTLSGCSVIAVSNENSDAADPEVATTQAIFSLTIGDCTVESEDSGEFADTEVINCTEPHDNEIYAASFVPDGDFPGEATIDLQARADCFDEFARFIGADYEDSIYGASWYYPTEGSWAEGDREILCLVYQRDGEQVTGSLAGAAR